jgi:selenocysteine lyase/cysteine desulfurase
MDPFLPDHSKLDALRELLPSLASGIRLDVTMAGPFPAETDRATQQLAAHELRVGRGGLERDEELGQRADEASSVLAAVLSASPDQVVLAPGPLVALSSALLAGGAPASGCVAIVGETTGRLEAVVGTVAAAHGLPTVRTTAAAIPPETVLVVAAHVDPATGRVADTVALADRAHAVGASLLLDAGWSVGAVAVDAPSSGADLVLADVHRWLLGPEGVTALWVADRAAAERIRALVDLPPLAQLVGVARSVGWLLMYVGLPWAFQRAESLVLRLRSALAKVDGVVMDVPDRGIAATLPFAIRDWSASEAAVELGRRAHALVEVDERRDLLLASVGAWLLEEEVDRFARAVAEIAAHSPQTLPRRPMLTILAAPADER